MEVMLVVTQMIGVPQDLYVAEDFALKGLLAIKKSYKSI
jgi:hypothetical protein